MAAELFAPKPGCPMCSIVAQSDTFVSPDPTSSSFLSRQNSFSSASGGGAGGGPRLDGASRPQILWRDANFTAYKERANPVSSKGHIVIAFNLHVPSLYTLSTSDLPLLHNLRTLAQRLLASMLPAYPPSSPGLTATSTSFPTSTTPLSPEVASQLRIGFVTPPFRDGKIPVTDHLHAHAYIAPADKCGWWRWSTAYGPLAWYNVDDLIAEIRESSTNNRIRSGGETPRAFAPIDRVPDAGTRTGTADGRETTVRSLAIDPDRDVEDGEGSLRASSSSDPDTTRGRLLRSPAQLVSISPAPSEAGPSTPTPQRRATLSPPVVGI